MDKDKVLDLAKLARIEMSGEEAESLSHEFEKILAYVSEVKQVSSTNGSQPTTDKHAVRNVMREDGEGHEAGIHTEKLLGSAPARDGDYVKVKKIL